MRFLLDQNQSPIVAELLNRMGHDAVHVRDLGMSRSSDSEILASAADDSRVVVSGDTDSLPADLNLVSVRRWAMKA